MADSLTLKGVNDVTRHTGTEMQLIPGNNTGSTLFPKWWERTANQVQYEDCSIFRVDIGGAYVRLVIPCGRSTTLDIKHDGSGQFLFGPQLYGPERAAVFPDDGAAPADIITEYQFPKISGGAIMVRYIGQLPNVNTTLGTASVSGPATSTEGETNTYSVSITGDASDLTYAWTIVGGNGSVASGAGTATVTVDWATEGTPNVQCVVSSTDVNLSGPTSITGTKSVTVAAA